jgi:hypothetical protein
MAMFIPYRWYLSADAQISSAGIVLGEIITSNEYLYAGGSTIVLETIAPEPWKHLF